MREPATGGRGGGRGRQSKFGLEGTRQEAPDKVAGDNGYKVPSLLAQRRHDKNVKHRKGNLHVVSWKVMRGWG